MTRLQEIRRQIRNLQAEEQRVVRAQMPAKAAARNAEAQRYRAEFEYRRNARHGRPQHDVLECNNGGV